MILPGILLVLATACTPDGIDREQAESTSCEAGFILDGSACVPESCGTGRWGTLPVDDDTVYVDVAAVEGGDGTEAAPYTTIQRGLDRAGALGGGLVAVAAGTYPETLAFTTEHADVHLAGRCREMVILDASVGDEETPGIGIDAGYGAVEVSGVTVRDSSFVGLWVESGVVSIQDMDVVGSTTMGILVIGEGTSVRLTNAAIRDTRPDTDKQWGDGIEVVRGAYLEAESCEVAGNTTVGIVAGDTGTSVIITDTVVRDTQLDENGQWGIGIEVYNGASLMARSCNVAGNSHVGVAGSDSDTSITLIDTAIRNTQPDRNGHFGYGIDVEYGATLNAEGCLIDGNADVGLLASDPGTWVTLVDTTVKDTSQAANGEIGRGINVQGGATLSAEGCLIDGNTDIGLFASKSGTEVTLWDSTISGTKPGTDKRASAASGVTVEEGAFLFASHLVVAANQGPGLLVNGASADGAWIDCTGCTIEGNQFAGAVTLAGGALTITDSTIEGTASSVNLLGGAGVYAWPWYGDPPTVTLTNNLIQDNPVAGVWLIGNGTYILTDNTISGGIGEPFGSGFRCGDAVLARDGVSAWDGTSGLLLLDNEFIDASGAGIFLDDSSSWMSGNTYSGNALDLVVQNQNCDPIPGYYSEAPQTDLCPIFSYPTCYAEFFFVAMPSDPVDWDEGIAAPRPRFLPTAPVASMAPIASLERPSRSLVPSARSEHPSYHPSLSR